MHYLLSALHLSLLLVAGSSNEASDCPAAADLPIGAVFGQSIGDARKRSALRFALADLGFELESPAGCPAAAQSIRPRPLVAMVPDRDATRAYLAACGLLNTGALALIGPDHPALTSADLAAIASATQAPIIDLRPSESLAAPGRADQPSAAPPFLLRLHPPLEQLAACLSSAIDYFDWHEALYVYEDLRAWLRLEAALRRRVSPETLYLRTRRYSIAAGPEPLLAEIEASGWATVVLDLSPASAAHFLRTAAALGMLGGSYHYVLANLNSAHLAAAYHGSLFNITAFRLEPSDRQHYDRVLAGLRDWQRQRQLRVGVGVGSASDDSGDSGRHAVRPEDEEFGPLEPDGHLTLEVALVYDAAQVLLKALADLHRSRQLVHNGGNGSGSGGSAFSRCSARPNQAASSPWPLGASLWNYLHSVDLPSTGLTGPIRFSRGVRAPIESSPVNLSRPESTGGLVVLHQRRDTGLVRLASCDSAGRLKLPNRKRPSGQQSTSGDFPTGGRLHGRRLRAVVVAAQPFVWIKREHRSRYLSPGGHILPGVEFHAHHLEGFCVDMIRLIANRTGLKWSVYRSPDDKYGSCVKPPGCHHRLASNGSAAPCQCQWNGMMAELVSGRADIALGSFTITYERERVIDFTKPFMNLGISILFKRPKGEKPGLFSFLMPLAVEVWVCVLAAYLVTTGIINLLGRLSPYEWTNPHPCVADPPYLVNELSLSNAFWFTVGTLMQQGSDISPRAASSRLVGVIWWFFTLILISSYTANLAAFLTVELVVMPIKNAEELSNQTAIEYGLLSGGSTEAFFETSHIATYSRMAKYMRARPGVKTATTSAGIERVKKGGYAFLMESAMIEYHIERECNLQQIGGLIDSKGYGIGVAPKREELGDMLTLKILELQRDQELQTLKNKWWKDTGICGGQDSQQSKNANPLDMQSIGGIFLVLVGGIIVSTLVAIVEFAWHWRKIRQSGQVNGAADLCSRMCQEAKFSLNCFGSSEKPQPQRACSEPCCEMPLLASPHHQLPQYQHVPPPPPPPVPPRQGSTLSPNPACYFRPLDIGGGGGGWPDFDF